MSIGMSSCAPVLGRKTCGCARDGMEGRRRLVFASHSTQRKRLSSHCHPHSLEE